MRANRSKTGPLLTLLVVLTAGFAAALAGSATAAAPRPLPNPDRAARVSTRQDLGPADGATASTSSLCTRLRSYASMGNSAGSLYAIDADSGKAICGRAARHSRVLASNTKLFTTSTALARLGPTQRLPTRLFGTGELDQDGVLHGNLYLKGGGDPTFGTAAFDRAYSAGAGTDVMALARQAHEAGIRSVTGRLFYDDTIFDRRRGVPDSGWRTSPYIGPLSGLSFNAGYTDTDFDRFSSDPAKLAGKTLAKDLGRAGIDLRPDVARHKTPSSADRTQVGLVRSPTVTRLVGMTLPESNNFFAEMLLKNIGARVAKKGTTRAGAKVVARFARAHGSGIHQVDGSGLTHSNRASPLQVVALLRYMRNSKLADDLVDALPVAGRTGTLAGRMQGTAAEGVCHAKTGTLTGVSTLSGYCFDRSGRNLIFSVLMNGVSDLTSAHLGQDRVAIALASL